MLDWGDKERGSGEASRDNTGLLRALRRRTKTPKTILKAFEKALKQMAGMTDFFECAREALQVKAEGKNKYVEPVPIRSEVDREENVAYREAAAIALREREKITVLRHAIAKKTKHAIARSENLHEHVVTDVTGQVEQAYSDLRRDIKIKLFPVGKKTREAPKVDWKKCAVGAGLLTMLAINNVAKIQLKAYDPVFQNSSKATTLTTQHLHQGIDQKKNLETIAELSDGLEDYFKKKLNGTSLSPTFTCEVPLIRTAKGDLVRSIFGLSNGRQKVLIDRSTYHYVR